MVTPNEPPKSSPPPSKKRRLSDAAQEIELVSQPKDMTDDLYNLSPDVQARLDVKKELEDARDQVGASNPPDGPCTSKTEATNTAVKRKAEANARVGGEVGGTVQNCSRTMAFEN
jgi:hypothetical protein